MTSSSRGPRSRLRAITHGTSVRPAASPRAGSRSTPARRRTAARARRRDSSRSPRPGRALAFDLRGAADGVDLRNLPARLSVPKLATDLSVAEYHVAGQGPNVSGSAVLNQSTVEGATLNAGTTAEFKTGRDGVSYGARGSVTGLNVRRVGNAMQIAALDKPAYEGTLNGDFDVAGSVPPQRRGAAGESRCRGADARRHGHADATRRSWAGALPRLAYETHLAGGALNILADGRFEGFDPLDARRIARKLAGTVTGTLNVNVQLADITAPVTPESIAAEGTVALEQSTVGGLAIDDASVDGKYAAQVGDLKRLQVNGPDVKVEASGRVALDRTSESNLKYHVEAIDLAELARLAGQTGVDGKRRARRHGHGQRRIAADDRDAGRQQRRLPREQGARPQQQVHRHRAGSEREADPRRGDTNATFVKVGALQLNAVTAKTTYSGDRLQFTTNVKEETRELDATGERDSPSRSPGDPPAAARGADAGRRVEDGARHRGDRPVRSGPRAAGEPPPGERRSGARRERRASRCKARRRRAPSRCRRRNVDLQQLETLLLQNRGLSGKLSAAATISGTAEAPVVDGHVEVVNGGIPELQVRVAHRRPRLHRRRIGVDATLQQSPTEAITAKGSRADDAVPEPGTGEHVDESADDHVDLHDQVHGDESRHRPGLHDSGHQRRRHARGGRARHRLRRGSAPPGLRRHQERRVRRSAGGVSYQRPQHPHRPRARQGAAAEVRDPRRARRAAERLRRARRARAPGRRRQHRDRLRQLRGHRQRARRCRQSTASSRSPASCAGRRFAATSGSRRRGSRSTGSCSCSTTRTRSRRCRRRLGRAHGRKGAAAREEATAAALERAETAAAVPGTRAQAEAGTAPTPGGAFAPVELDVRLVDPRQPRAARQEAAAGRPDRRGARRHEHHRRRRPAGRQGGRAARCCCSARSRRCAAPTSSRGAASIWCAAARCGSSASRDQSGPRRQRDAD